MDLYIYFYTQYRYTKHILIQPLHFHNKHIEMSIGLLELPKYTVLLKPPCKPNLRQITQTKQVCIIKLDTLSEQ